MPDVDLPLWEDDPFVQSALRSLPIPDHHPDFWDQLAGGLDAAADAAGLASSAPVRRLPTSTAGPRPAHPPRLAPLRAGSAPAPAPVEPVRLEPARLEPARQMFVPSPEVELPPVVAAAAAAAVAPVTRGTVLPELPASPTAPIVRRSPREVDELVLDRDLAVVPQALRRKGNVVLAAMTVAAAVVVVVAGTTLIRQRSDDGTIAATDTTSVEDADNTSFVSDGIAGADDPATAAVLAWVAALGEGDAGAAWEALGAESQRHFGDQDAFEDEMSALAEGFGAWGGVTPDEILVTPLSASGDGTLSVVTLVGTVEQEGDTEERTDAFPVRIVDGDAELEPFADGGTIDFVTPLPGGEADLDEAVVVDFPTGIDTPVIRIGDSGPARCGEGGGTTLRAVDASTQRCTFIPGGDEPKGERVVTVAFTSSDGSEISARSMRYDAA